MIVLYAAVGSPAPTSLMYFGISTMAGHSSRHFPSFLMMGGIGPLTFLCRSVPTSGPIFSILPPRSMFIAMNF